MEVCIRPWLQTDLEPLLLLANNKKITDNLRDFFPHPYTKADAEEWLSFNTGVNPVTNFVIEADGYFAGAIGVMPKTDVYRKSIEIGYWLGEPYWGKGIVSNAIHLMLQKIWRDYPHVNRVYAEVFEHNKASMRVLEKNGFYLESIRKQAVIKNDMLLDDYVWVLLRS